MSRLVAVVVVLGLVAAACGDDVGAEDGAEAVTSTVPTLDPFPTLTTTTRPPTTTVVDFFFEAGAIGGDEAPVDGREAYAVTSPHPLATDVGMDVLSEGGSAVDAAIAIQAMLGLVEPHLSGLGGGGVMLHYDSKTQVLTAYDGREEAPAGARADMFLEDGAPVGVVDAARTGASIGTPGVVAMLALAHEDHGELAWSRGFQPAIVRARRGVEVSPSVAEAIALAVVVGASDDLVALYSDDSGRLLEEGDTFVNPTYAETLTALAAERRAVYEGEIAAAIVTAAGAPPGPGTLSLADLADYEARRLDPLCRSYREWTLCGAPPPSSGGVGVLSLMGQLENVGIAPLGPSAVGWHLFIEASRRAYADREVYVADDRVVAVPVEELLDDTYLASRASTIESSDATPDVAAGVLDGFARGPDSTAESTAGSHVVVVDRDGDVVTMSSGLGAAFGSRRVAAGVVLNAQLTEFAFTPTAGGLGVANAVAPGKRPRSPMAPTLVLDVGGDVRLAVGSSSGVSTIADVARTIVAVLDWGLDGDDAIALPAVVGRPDSVTVEVPAASISVVDSLEALGHPVTPVPEHAGRIQLVEIANDGTLTGAADARGAGTFDTTTG